MEELIGTVSTTKAGLMSSVQYFNSGYSFENKLPGLYKIASLGNQNNSVYARIIQTNLANNAVLAITEFVIAGTSSNYAVNAFRKHSIDGELYSRLYKKEGELYIRLLPGMISICSHAKFTSSLFHPILSEYTEEDLELVNVMDY